MVRYVTRVMIEQRVLQYRHGENQFEKIEKNMLKLVIISNFQKASEGCIIFQCN